MTDFAPADLARDNRLEVLLGRHGIPWEMIAAAPGEVDWVASLAAQVRDDGVDEDLVDAYAGALERGDPLPPGVAYRADSGLVVFGGHHRSLAHQRQDRHIPLYLAQRPDARTQLLISIEHNAHHGQRFTTGQQGQLAADLVERHRMTYAEAAEVVGISRGRVGQVMSERAAVKRIRRSGHYGVFAALPGGVRRAITSAASALSDEVLDELILTVNNCDLDTGQTVDLVRMVKAVESDEDRLGVLSDAEEMDHPIQVRRRVSGPPATVAARNTVMKLNDIPAVDVAQRMEYGTERATRATLVRGMETLAGMIREVDRVISERQVPPGR